MGVVKNLLYFAGSVIFLSSCASLEKSDLCEKNRRIFQMYQLSIDDFRKKLSDPEKEIEIYDLKNPIYTKALDSGSKKTCMQKKGNKSCEFEFTKKVFSKYRESSARLHEIATYSCDYLGDKPTPDERFRDSVIESHSGLLSYGQANDYFERLSEKADDYLKIHQNVKAELKNFTLIAQLLTNLPDSFDVEILVRYFKNKKPFENYYDIQLPSWWLIFKDEINEFSKASLGKSFDIKKSENFKSTVGLLPEDAKMLRKLQIQSALLYAFHDLRLFMNFNQQINLILNDATPLPIDSKTAKSLCESLSTELDKVGLNLENSQEIRLSDKLFITNPLPQRCEDSLSRGSGSDDEEQDRKLNILRELISNKEERRVLLYNLIVVNSKIEAKRQNEESFTVDIQIDFPSILKNFPLKKINELTSKK